MAETTETGADASAEKAYAAAAEAVAVKPEPEVAPAVEFPPKATRAPKVAAPVADKAAPVAKPAPAVKPAPAAKKTPAVKPAPVAKKTKAKAAAKPAALKPSTVTRKAKAKPVTKKSVVKAPAPAKAKTAAKPKTTPKLAAAAKPVAAAKSVFQQLKEKTMDTAEITTKMKSAVAEVQVKAKEAFDKGAAAFGEYNEFSKGNLEAVVESGKILASGMQSFGTTLVADTKANFETLTAEVKELSAVKSPADFFKLQAAFLRRNFDLAVAQTSKNSEAVLKLANEAAAPISGRVSLAVEKIKKAA